MENPYAAPVAAPLASTRHPPKKMLWWKIFFWFLVMLEGAAFITIFRENDSLAWDDICEVVVYVFIIAGVFGFAYQRALFAELFWRGVVPIAALWDIFLMGQNVYEERHQEYFLVIVVALFVIFSPLIFFQYLALYKYAFQSSYLWAGKTNRVTSD